MLKKFFKNKWVRAILIIHGLALIFFIVMFFYIRHLTVTHYEASIVKTPYDAIVVPGYPFTDGKWAEIMKARVHWSKYLLEKGYTKNIIYSGSAVYSPYVESKIMKTYAEALGLPENHLFAETQAEHSTENLYYSYQIAKNNGFKRVALATDPFQSFFLMQFAEDYKMDVDYMPIQYGLLEQLNLTDPKIDPSSAFVPNFVALPERQGFYQRFRGTLGKHINERSD